jgi:sporulation protein YlmC with PRC-barrel domain
MRKSIIAALALIGMAGGAMAEMAGPRFISLSAPDILSSNVVGLDVYDTHNKALGKIQDVAFDTDKAVKGYILSVGGVLGMGAHYVAVDPSAVAIKYDNGDKRWHANMDSTVDQLKSAPEFKYEGEWNASKS